MVARKPIMILLPNFYTNEKKLSKELGIIYFERSPATYLAIISVTGICNTLRLMEDQARAAIV